MANLCCEEVTPIGSFDFSRRHLWARKINDVLANFEWFGGGGGIESRENDKGGEDEAHIN